MQPYSPDFLCNQAQHTKPTRQYFYTKGNWNEGPVSLDLGCGTGVITPELTQAAPCAQTIGIDINPTLISQATTNLQLNPSIHLIVADANKIPFRQSIFSFVLCHFTLMWIPTRNEALIEIHRIIRPTGIFSAIEPDYSGRIEVPHQPQVASRYPIIHYLIRKKADPFIGGQLPIELPNLGFGNIEFGILSWQYNPKLTKTEIEEEATLLRESGISWILPQITYTPIFWIIASKLDKQTDTG
ncbi:MAG: class I SAM-dependent methyltransferase [Candidatus Thorarchaeota archaeon]